MQSFLELNKIGEVREDKRVIQVDDGTIFYWQFSLPHRLFVKMHDRKIDAKLPSKEIKCSGSHGDSVYFASTGKIFKATFSPSDGIAVLYFRDEVKNEVGRWGFYSIARGNEKYVYRLCDDPNSYGSLINVTNEELNGLQVRRIHRKNVILSSQSADSMWPSARKVRENTIVVETRGQYALFVSDNSPLLYLTDGRNVFILDTISMRFLPTLEFRDAHVSYIVGVHEAELTCMGMKNGEYCLMAAPLPQDYSNEQEREMADALKDRDEQMIYLQSDDKLKDELSLQREQNSHLIKENNRIAKLEEENCHLKNEIAELRQEITDLSEEEEGLDEIRESATLKESPGPAELELSPAPVDPETDTSIHVKSPETSL